MDGFDAVRLSAAALHDQAVAAGADPMDPMSLINAALKHLELELYWLAPGDPALKGAHALFDEQSGSVCCEDQGEPGERAILVGHEIGHACVHAVSYACRAA